NVTLNPVTVTDDLAGAVTCPQATLVAGARSEERRVGKEGRGQWTKIGTVTGTPPAGLPNVTATNPDHYFGATPAVTIVKKTNDTDNDVAPGPTVAVASTVSCTYDVTNAVNVTLNPVTVTDDLAGAVTCPQATLVAGA